MCFLFAFSAKPFEWNEDSGFTVIGSFLLAGWVSLSLRRKSFFYFILFFFNFNPRFFKLFHTSTHRCAFAKWIGRPKSLLSVILLDLKTANLHFHTSIYEVFVFLFLFSMFCIVFDVSVFLFYFGSFDSGSSPDFVALKLFTYTLIHSHSHSHPTYTLSQTIVWVSLRQRTCMCAMSVMVIPVYVLIRLICLKREIEWEKLILFCYGFNRCIVLVSAGFLFEMSFLSMMVWLSKS